MDLKTVDYDQLPARLETQANLLDASAGWIPTSFSRIEQARKMGYPTAPYFGVYAVERGRVLSSVRVIRVPFTLASGSVETVSGIQGVVTRREWSRRGIARSLLAEAHRRESEAGIRFVLLWTGHGLAHGLYTSIGYEDIYTPELGMRKCEGERPDRGGYELKAVKRADWATIERLHADSTAGRVGFTPRPPGLLASLLTLFYGQSSFRLVLRDGRPVGYMQLDKGPGYERTGEIVLADPADADGVLSLLESEASGRLLVITGTFVRDNRELLRRRGFAFTDHAYYGLLAKSLDGASRNLTKEMGATNKRFTCHFLDHF